MKANLLIVSGNKMINQIMEGSDLGNHKHYGYLQEISISYKENEIVNFKRVGKIFPAIKEGLEKIGEKVVFIHLKEIVDDNKIIQNKTLLPWFDKSIREVSDGQKWCLFADFIRQLKFEVKTNENMFIDHISFIKTKNNKL